MSKIRNEDKHARLTETYALLVQGHEWALAGGRRTLAERINFKLRFQFLPHYFSTVPNWRLRLRKYGGPRILPEFLCLGAIKNGTSDLSTYLLQHPCIMTPLSKEIRATNPERWRPYYPTVQEKTRVEMEHGKALSGYFYPNMNSLPLMDSYRAAVPDGKIILMLRNPVDRAYSHYKWDLLYGGKQRLKITTFAAYVDLAIDLFPTNPLPSFYAGWELLQVGIYVKSVEMWMNRFGRENVHIVRSEDFFKDIPGTVCSIHEFLGLPAVAPKIHPIMNQNPMKPPPFEAETRRKLQEFYRPWNEKLYALLDRDMEWEK